MIDINHFSVYI